MKSINIRAALVVSALALAAPAAHAAFHLFRIDQVYSNADGSVQYVVMKESSGTNGENIWAGNDISTTSTAGVRKTFRFPGNIPANTASRSVLIATAGFAALGVVTPDYTVPDRFIPTDGGSMQYASGIDQIALPALPTDGVTAINRNGVPIPAIPRNFANATAAMTATPVTNVEFFNQGLNHYFMSSLAPDIDALDSGRISGWTRTGLSFFVYPSQAAGGAGVNPVCRIIIPPPHGDSHFFSASPQECADTLTKFPFMSQETPAAFFIALPVETGATAGTCPAGTIAVYRAFDNRADANHRYTTDRSIRDQMVAMGYIAEGYGDDAVIMCAPASATAAAAAPAAGVPNDGSMPGSSDPMPDPGGYGYGQP